MLGLAERNLNLTCFLDALGLSVTSIPSIMIDICDDIDMTFADDSDSDGRV